MCVGRQLFTEYASNCRTHYWIHKTTILFVYCNNVNQDTPGLVCIIQLDLKAPPLHINCYKHPKAIVQNIDSPLDSGHKIDVLAHCLCQVLTGYTLQGVSLVNNLHEQQKNWHVPFCLERSMYMHHSSIFTGDMWHWCNHEMFGFRFPPPPVCLLCFLLYRDPRRGRGQEVPGRWD